MNDKLRVMTYNISWELLESVDSGRLDMSHCKLSSASDNECSNNIAKIICQIGICKINSNESNQQLYDFINLQEILNKKNQWVYLENKINQLEPTFLQNYNIEFTEDLPAGIITLYNKNKYNLIYKLDGKLSFSDNRPYQILVFKENIININVHFPHFSFKQEEALQILSCQLNKLKLVPLLAGIDFTEYKIIMSGDFNNNDPTQLMNFPLLLIGFGKTFYREPNKLVTCCSPHNYNKSYDHIYYSDCQASEYKTLNDSEYFIKSNKKMMSDHLPVFAVFPIFPILDCSESRKYKINYEL